jgi:ABC-type glycerol-3-phosphate transport system substrate-binding protein
MTQPSGPQLSGLGAAFGAVASGSPNAAQAVNNFAQQVQQQVTQSQQIKTAAAAGQLAVTPDAAQKMITAYRNALHTWLLGERDVAYTCQDYMLGSTLGAKAIAPWNQQVAQQLKTAYDQLETVYQNQVDAYTQAIKNYQDNEARVSESLRKAGER